MLYNVFRFERTGGSRFVALGSGLWGSMAYEPKFQGAAKQIVCLAGADMVVDGQSQTCTTLYT